MTTYSGPTRGKRISDTWDHDGDVLVHYARHLSVPDYYDARSDLACRHETEVVHHGFAVAPRIVDLMQCDAAPEIVAEAIRLLHAEVTRPVTPPPPPPVVAHTPNGREIRLVRGKYEVQPRNDNYWIACDTLEDALDAYEHPAKYR